MKTKWILKAAFALCCIDFACTPVAAQDAKPISNADAACSPYPALLEGWKREVIRERGVAGMSDDELRAYVMGLRSTRISQLRNPFEPLGSMTTAERSQEGEHVLWESRRVMVLVDSHNPLPKVLIVPKLKGVWTPLDAPDDLLAELATVAQAAGDAITGTLGESCSPAFTGIQINGPQEIMVQQLHIHVFPVRDPTRTLSQFDLTHGISSRLANRLGPAIRDRAD